MALIWRKVETVGFSNLILKSRAFGNALGSETELNSFSLAILRTLGVREAI